MRMQPLFVRAVLMLLFAVSLMVVLAHRTTDRVDGLRTAETHVDAVQLPTIVVRPTPGELAALRAGMSAPTVLDQVAKRATPLDESSSALFAAPLRLDMPYYSFGRSMPRVRKE